MMNEDSFLGCSAVQVDNFLQIVGGLHSPPINEIWMCNLYTEEWGKYVIAESDFAPEPFHSAVAVAINGSIYTFGGIDCGGNRIRNALWILHKIKTGCFVWSFVKFHNDKASPSPRTGHTGWNYAGKLWVFGGKGPSPQYYLDDYGDIAGNHDSVVNNQLLCYNPNIQKWINPQCFGNEPAPRFNHTSTIIKHNVWVFGGCDQSWTFHDDMFQLSMDFLTWTRIQTVQPRPQARRWFALTALTNNQLVLHGGKSGTWNNETLNDTWIMDLTSCSWRQYKSRKDHIQKGHTRSFCLNNVIIVGGRQGGKNGFEGGDEFLNESHGCVSNWMLEAKSLQQLAAQTIYKYQDEINWKCLPKKLISQLGLPIKEKRCTCSFRV